MPFKIMFCHFRLPPKLVEPEKEENDDYDDDDEDDDLMVPKVKVAEDGTLILDEDRYGKLTISKL